MSHGVIAMPGHHNTVNGLWTEDSDIKNDRFGISTLTYNIENWLTYDLHGFSKYATLGFFTVKARDKTKK